MSNASLAATVTEPGWPGSTCTDGPAWHAFDLSCAAYHLARRAPKETASFAWGRSPTVDGSATTWRLYRRDHRRALHMHVLTFFAHEDRTVIAGHLRRALRYLRDKVDDIDLVAMGVAA
ncbi:hypothetical protein [Stenotrophomonas maltophilia]|uniref:hypothetical protein n=1 Tax=Stenotrophomonas maltophilia TaxID=40324 RepID=UPI001E62829C|nr:hypothetical protein [Stenotrophomonas maltophilia]